MCSELICAFVHFVGLFLSSLLKMHGPKNKTKLRGLSPRANYTDRAAAAGRRS